MNNLPAAVQRAVRSAVRANDRDRDEPVRIPRKQRPDIALLWDRADTTKPGTLAVDASGMTATLYVGRHRYGALIDREQATQLRVFRRLVIVSTTQVAGTDARKHLNQHWKLDDIADSGLLPADTLTLVQGT